MKKIITILLFATGMLHAQSNTENYISTRTYLEPTTTSNPYVKNAETVQYFDGLGRLKQGIAVKASPTGKDIVSYIEYDATGRQTKNYLPVPQSGTQNGLIYTSPLGNASAVYGSEKIYSESILDNSPLNRVLQQTSIGTEWNTKPVQFGYDTNGVNEVYHYTVTTTWENGTTKNVLSLPSDQAYPPNQLFKSTVKDEDDSQTVEFKNKNGQTILSRKMLNASEHVDTYYVYNEYGQLAFVLPPNTLHKTISEELLNDLCYQYRYDTWGRMVEKKLPGKDWELMVYDKQDRLVATQDGKLREKGQWLYTKYDKFGRVAITGLSTGGERLQEQSIADSYGTNNVDRLTNVLFERQGMGVYYGNPDATYPNSTKWVSLLSLNYYDSYPVYSFNPAFPSAVLGQPVLKEVPLEGKTTKGLPVMNLVKNVEDDNWTKSYLYYDLKGRAVGSYSINHLGGYTRTESVLDFAGVTQQSKVYHKRLAADTEKVITQTFTYDAQNRMLVHKHQIDTQPEEILAQYEYNELSQVKNKKLGGTNTAQPLQSIDYTYNIKGWLTKINDPSDLNGKLFGYELKYTNPVNPNIAPGKFNGNIAEVDWRNASEGTMKRYNYTYDGLNRLKDAVYSEPNSTIPFNNNYNEYVTYDPNGNIKTLKRNAFPVTGSTATQVDDLVYEYSGNRLTKVTENALNDTGYEGGNNVISYDVNGNMKDMRDKGIQSIAYNYLNLSNEFTMQQNSFGLLFYSAVNYLYSADGTKLRKTYSSRPQRGLTSYRTTDYLDGFQYSHFDGGGDICLGCRTENAYEVQAYKNIFDPGIPVTPEWKLDFVVTAEGFYSFTENRYIYQYRDHLGNTRVNFTKNSAGAPEIIDTNNYYPFGLNHTGGSGLNNSLFGSFNSYKYNGKELQETGMFDYGWRQYMPDLGRWNGMDQLAESYLSTSPYAYVANNPILQFDVDGRWFNQDGTIDTSGATPGYTSGRVMMTQFYGSNIWEGGGSGDFSAVLATASGLGGTWSNTGLGFLDSNGILLGYDGSYKSLNVNFTEGGIGEAINYVPEVFVTGKKGGGFFKGSYNSFMMENAMNNARLGWNLSQSRSLLYDAIENTKVGQSVSAAENFMFLELPASLAGGELLAAGWRAAGIGKLICGPAGRLTGGLVKICFTEGTLVAIEKGSKKIEDIKEGDLVWSYNEETGKKELKKVVELSRNTSSSLVKISLNSTEITCTPEHPFYVNGSWVEAKDLTQGMLLTTLDGKTSPVESIKFLDEKVKVYNFEVEGNHNYYVSEKGILVHNNCEWLEATIGQAKNWVSTEPGMQSIKAVDDIVVKLTKNDPFVFAQPIKVVEAEGRTFILNGHHRIEAAIKMGYEGVIPYQKIPASQISQHSGFSSIGELVKAFGH
ncbi:DUF6443 domain-containing protein [Chryseobacterium arthrosphaerae]|uniref:DUF6443 domain-containing protein n=1 Tax=Chryseobacterium arthrosphaerae TaxID=651561 RepID=UPI001BAF8335|nr:DUF6443 domain-containing protein [Chryseobacterium arthrosphaerae]QUY54540.1 hypothetical protein I2F65_16860 [Chryseobacterium arthrosphaerae]